MELLQKINGKLRKLEEGILSWSIIFMAVILVANVLCRVVFRVSLTFAEEVSSILTVILTFVGVSYAARIGRHITMTALFDAVGLKGKKIFAYISSLITCFFLVYLSYISLMYVVKMFNTGRYTSALQIPMWIPYCIIPLGFFLGAIQYLSIFALNVRDRDIAHTCVEPVPDEYADEPVETGNEKEENK